MLTWYLGFNARRAPLDDPRVRRALARRSTGTARRSSYKQRGRNGRIASADDAGAFAPRRPRNSTRSCPRPPERGGHADGRALGEITLVCLDLWEDAASDAAQLAAIGVRVRLLPATSDPEVLRRSSRAVPTPSSGAGLPATPTRAAASSSRFSCTTRAFCTAISSSSSCWLGGHAPRRGRAPPHLPRVRARLDRRPSGRRTARVRRRQLWRRPWLTRHVGERHARRRSPTPSSRSDLRCHSRTTLTRYCRRQRRLHPPSLRKRLTTSLNAAPCSPLDHEPACRLDPANGVRCRPGRVGKGSTVMTCPAECVRFGFGSFRVLQDCGSRPERHRHSQGACSLLGRLTRGPHGGGPPSDHRKPNRSSQ